VTLPTYIGVVHMCSLHDQAAAVAGTAAIVRSLANAFGST
jgi:hypothetical protein